MRVMKMPEFKPTMTEAEWTAARDASDLAFGTYHEFVELEKDDFSARTNKAQEVYLRYTNDLARCEDDRAEVSRIRDIMRADIEFVEVSDMIETMTDNSMNWVNAVLRSEARRAGREGMERLQQIRAEKAAARAAEKAAEAAELEGMTNFGMF